MLYKVAQLILTTYDIKKKKETHSVNLLKGYKTLFVGAKLDRLIYGNSLRVKIREEHARFIPRIPKMSNLRALRCPGKPQCISLKYTYMCYL